MLTLKELKKSYDNSHPYYEQLMNRADITDKKLNKIKREILQPYLEEQKLEGRVIVYKEKYAGFVVISDVEMTEKGFKASIQALDPLDQPYEHHKHTEGSRWKIGGPWNMLMCYNQHRLFLCGLEYLAGSLLYQIHRRQLRH